MPNIPSNCPACGVRMMITELKCDRCNTVVQGNFPLTKLISLSEEDREFLMTFLRSRGNIREVQERMGISYPTVKNKLDRLLAALGLFDEIKKPNRTELLSALSNGEISLEETIQLLKENHSSF